MLMLNPLTLYYMNLSHNYMTQMNGGLIKEWASTVSKLTSKPLSTASSSSTLSTIPHSTITQITSQCSTTSMTKVIVPPVFPNDDIGPNGLSDHDETIGKEWDAAVNSPHKNGVCVMSSVSTTCLSFIYYKHTISIFIGHCEDQHRAQNDQIVNRQTRQKEWPKAPPLRVFSALHYSTGS